MKNWLKNICVAAGIFMGIHYVGILFGVKVFSPKIFAAKVQMSYFSELKTLSDVLRLVQFKYVEEEIAQNKEKLIEGGIEGILKKLDDPFSRYMPPQQFKSMQEEIEGEFGGLGILLGVRDDILTIISPMEGTPAFRAGVRSGDKIIKINGSPTEGMSSEQAVKILRGEPKTTVNISIFREGNKELIEYNIERDYIKVPSAKAGMIDENIGYARLTGFVQTSGADLEKELNIIEKRNPNLKGFILDLRGNPGGLLTAAVEISQIFLQKDETVVSIKGRHSDDAVFKTKATSHKKWPLVVLIDGGSASASEIVAGAIRDNKRGILVGTKTFGKGSVQTVLPLNDGSALALTTAYYYTPGNHLIHKKGISPDIEVLFPNLTNEQLKEYRDELEKLSLEDYEETKQKQDQFLRDSQKNDNDTDTTDGANIINKETKPVKSESTSGIEIKEQPDSEKADQSIDTEKDKSDDKKDKFMRIHSQDIQLQRAVEVLRAVDVFYSSLLTAEK